MTTLSRLSAVAIVCLCSTPCFARQWTDSTGKFTVEAELVSFNADTVVLQKANHEVIAIPLDKLSAKDREYLKSKEVTDAQEQQSKQFHTWTLVGGKQVVGHIVDYGRKDVTIQRRRGRIYINDRHFENLPEVYQTMIPLIVGHFEKQDIPDRRALEKWVLELKGEPKTFTCEGVILELENGDEYAVPFFFFSDEDLKVLQPGWERWKTVAGAKADQQEAQAKRERESFMLQSAAQAYQRDRQANQQISMMQLELLGVASGVVDLWEVAIFPTSAAAGPPRSVVVPARDSRAATIAALQRYPGYTAGAARRLNRNNTF